ncbi:MAG: 2-dehydropantoate 2-reductase [Beijerinckiaceae bacterium]|nr:2-dehydropantoate 2-reductase [Beijerinckiaceae bacterium]
MRILVLGAGATGGYFGGRLAEAGADVTFLLRPARAARIAADGLRIKSPDGDSALEVATITQATSPFDLIVMSCKAYDLDSAITAIAPAVEANTTILPLLNGLAHYAPLDTAFGADKVIGGLCHIMATVTPDGAIRHLGGPPASVTFGERGGGASARVEAIAASFAPALFTTRPSPNVMQEAWEKLSLIATLAGATCLMRASIGDIVATQDGEAIIRALYAECEAIAAASGYPLRPKAAASTLAILTEPGSKATASMLRDLEAGRRVEAAEIPGDLVARARSLGLAVPHLRAAYCHLQCYEARRAQAAPAV